MNSPTHSTNVFRIANTRSWASPFRTALFMTSLLIQDILRSVAGGGAPSFVPIIRDGYAHPEYPLHHRHHTRTWGVLLALGLLPVSTMEQLEFVAGHSAFKRIAIKPDQGAPARLPNRWEALTETYAGMKAQQTGSEDG